MNQERRVLKTENRYPLPILGTNYEIDILGDITNKRTGTILKSNYTKKEGQRNTNIYYKPRVKKRLNRRKKKPTLKFWGGSKTISNARFMLDTYFIIQFKYKIFYKDGDLSNTCIDNLIIRQNEKFNTIDGSELLTTIEKCYMINEDGSVYYQKPIIKDV